MAASDLILRLARLFTARKKQLVFLINNYDLVLSVIREALAVAADREGREAKDRQSGGVEDAGRGREEGGAVAASLHGCRATIDFFEGQLQRRAA